MYAEDTAAIMAARTIRQAIAGLTPLGYKPPRELTAALDNAERSATYANQPPRSDLAELTTNAKPADLVTIITNHATATVVGANTVWVPAANEVGAAFARHARALFQPRDCLALVRDPYLTAAADLADALESIPVNLRDQADKMLNAGPAVQAAYLRARDAVAELESIKDTRTKIATLDVQVRHEDMQAVMATVFTRFDGFPAVDAYTRAVRNSPEWLHGWDATITHGTPWLPDGADQIAHVKEIAVDRKEYKRDNLGRLVYDPAAKHHSGVIMA